MQNRSGRRCGELIRISFLFVLTYLNFFSFTVYALDAGYLESVLDAAGEQRLYEDPYWHILLHYEKGIRGYISLVDDPRFFLSPEGKTNPEAELKATIRAFFEPQEEGKDPVVCRFVARFEWLKERLNIDTGRLPVAGCSSYMDFLDRTKPRSATLVFPMAHLNSPASMFGHTLITIETANQSKLLSYSVSYSAHADETFGPFFAVKGIFGLYPGYFSTLPYYAKLQEYRDIDRRDIWEYTLNLTEPEIRKMMLHIREMDSIASDYYFFDENCSYLLFYLLEAARPTVRFTDKVHGWLIPLDSVRMIDEQGLVSGVRYRPSRTTKVKSLASEMSARDKADALALARGTMKGFRSGDAGTAQEKMKICELAGEYLQYLYTKKEVEEAVYQERFLNILKMRSRLGIAKEEDPQQSVHPVQPDKGHRSGRLGIGLGFRQDEFFEELRIRAAYHDLMDDDRGYVEGAQLIFAELGLRHYPSGHKLSLQFLDIIDIFSLSPMDPFFHPISWKIKTGFTRIAGDDRHEHLVYEVNPGGGIAFQNSVAGLTYIMLETGFNAGGALEHNNAVGIGGSAGFLKRPRDFWKVHVFARDIYYGLGDTFNDFEAAVQQSFHLNPNQSISVDVSRRKTRDLYQTEAKVHWNFFF
jgi:hypothetical protein